MEEKNRVKIATKCYAFCPAEFAKLRKEVENGIDVCSLSLPFTHMTEINGHSSYPYVLDEYSVYYKMWIHIANLTSQIEVINRMYILFLIDSHNMEYIKQITYFVKKNMDSFAFIFNNLNNFFVEYQEVFIDENEYAGYDFKQDFFELNREINKLNRRYMLTDKNFNYDYLIIEWFVLLNEYIPFFMTLIACFEFVEEEKDASK